LSVYQVVQKQRNISDIDNEKSGSNVTKRNANLHSKVFLSSSVNHLLAYQKNNNRAGKGSLRSGVHFNFANIQTKLKVSQPDDIYEQEADRIADQVMMHVSSTETNIGIQDINDKKVHRKCKSCKDEEEKMKINMKTSNEKVGNLISDNIEDIIGNTISQGGSALDPSTKEFMESHFGFDFSRVRIHTDERAVESAQVLNAMAYTVGSDIVFGDGQFAPATEKGKKLLAHELTHVVQQLKMPSLDVPLRPMTKIKPKINFEKTIQVSISSPDNVVYRQTDKNTLDEEAKKIIEKANHTRPIKERAEEAVQAIINVYYPSYKSKSIVVEYNEKEPGLSASPFKKGEKNKKPIIYVGKYFVENIDKFARRVLQVGHELQHLDQYESGMTGEGKKDKREFLAFYWEATEKEKAGTGIMSYATRRTLIDTALGHYYCLDAKEQPNFIDKRDKLLKLREEINGKGGNKPTPAPTICKRQ
jgi:hypothetical protein